MKKNLAFKMKFIIVDTVYCKFSLISDFPLQNRKFRNLLKEVSKKGKKKYLDKGLTLKSNGPPQDTSTPESEGDVQSPSYF